MMAGQEVNERIISDILRRKQNTMRPIASHREVIYNIDDVEEEFGSDKSLQQFLRETR
jgi:broad specificity phosphatase PhoE